MPPPAKTAILDSDTLAKWIFDSASHQPVVAYEALRRDGYVLFSPFPVVADLYEFARFESEKLSDAPDVIDFLTVAMATIDEWFTTAVNTLHCDEQLSRRWLSVAKQPTPHENANREHIWIAVTAEYLNKMRFDATIVSEDPGIYTAILARCDIVGPSIFAP